MVTIALGSTLATVLLSRDVSLVQGVLAFLVLVGMQFAITRTSIRVGFVRRAAKSEPTTLVYQGRVLAAAARRERVLEAELEAAVREHGHAGLDAVDLVVLETDGSFSVVPRLEPGRLPSGVSPLGEIR